MSGVAGRLRREWDEFVGPGASRTVTAITLLLGVLGGALAPTLARDRPRGRFADVVVRLFAVDLWGGAWVNNTRTCARWYERPGQTDGDHLRFAALHLHPVLLAYLDREQPHRTRWAAAHYVYLMAATQVIRRNWRHRRTLGVAATLGGIALDVGLGPSKAAPWFGSVYYTKLLLGHASAAVWSKAALTERH